MSPEKPVYAAPKTHEFLKAAIKDCNNPVGQLYQKSPRNLNIFGSYFATSGTLESIGKIYGLTRERTRKIVESGLIFVHGHSSSQLQEEHPIALLPLRKPMYPESQYYRAIARGGASSVIAELLEKDVSAEEIKAVTEQLGMDLGKVRGQFRRWGKVVPRLLQDHRELPDQFKKETDPEKIQSLMDQAPWWWLLKNSCGENSLFVSVKNVVSGFHISSALIPEVVESLRLSKIPLRMIKRKGSYSPAGEGTFYLICRQDRAKAVEFLKTVPKWTDRKDPVVQICGAPEDQPTVWQLTHNQTYISPGRILQVLGTSISNVDYSNLFDEECPVSVYQTSYIGHGRYFCAIHSVEDLFKVAIYLRKRVLFLHDDSH